MIDNNGTAVVIDDDPLLRHYFSDGRIIFFLFFRVLFASGFILFCFFIHVQIKLVFLFSFWFLLSPPHSTPTASTSFSNRHQNLYRSCLPQRWPRLSSWTCEGYKRQKICRQSSFQVLLLLSPVLSLIVSLIVQILKK